MLPAQLRDLFGNEQTQGKYYELYRPQYPEQYLFRILKLLGNNSQRKTYLDVACGTGKLLFELSPFFELSIGNDISDVMLKECAEHAKTLDQNIVIKKWDSHEIEKLIQTVSNEQNVDLSSGLNLITVGEALHWFDVEKFFGQVQKLLKPEGLFMVSGYFVKGFELNSETSPMKREAQQYVDQFFDQLKLHFDYDITDLQTAFQSYPFEKYFHQIHYVKEDFLKETTVDGFIGYLKTYSGYNTYLQRNQIKTLEDDPLHQLKEKIEKMIVLEEEKNGDLGTFKIQMKNIYFMRVFRHLQ